MARYSVSEIGKQMVQDFRVVALDCSAMIHHPSLAKEQWIDHGYFRATRQRRSSSLE